jgi:hypothetical protein
MAKNSERPTKNELAEISVAKICPHLSALRPRSIKIAELNNGSAIK